LNLDPDRRLGHRKRTVAQIVLSAAEIADMQRTGYDLRQQHVTITITIASRSA
jgi:hypothetical protein